MECLLSPDEHENHTAVYDTAAGTFFYLWGNASSAFGLAKAFLASVYIVISARFEERQLISTYGDAYRRYA